MTAERREKWGQRSITSFFGGIAILAVGYVLQITSIIRYVIILGVAVAGTSLLPFVFMVRSMRTADPEDVTVTQYRNKWLKRGGVLFFSSILMMFVAVQFKFLPTQFRYFLGDLFPIAFLFSILLILLMAMSMPPPKPKPKQEPEPIDYSKMPPFKRFVLTSKASRKWEAHKAIGLVETIIRQVDNRTPIHFEVFAEEEYADFRTQE